MYRILIVEDVPAEADVLKGHLERYAAAHGVRFSIEVLPSALEFINSQHVADLIFMDIDMPGINGMEAAEILRGYDETTPLIFVTNLSQYAVRGYQVDALDYVLKPVEYENFAMRMNRAMRILERDKGATLAIPTENGMRVVRQSEVVYVDILKHDLHYHLTDGSELRMRGSLKAAEEELDQQMFVRISASCIINITRVSYIHPDSVVMDDGTELFYSRSRRKHALEVLNEYVGRSL